METYKDIPVMSFASQQHWQEWLKKNYELQSGIWLKIAKKGTGIASVNHALALDIALCWGWIDGQAKSLDDVYYLQKFTPRRPRSIWSKVNVAKVEGFIADGSMQAPGLAAIEAAKADGRWDAAYESPKNMTMQPDFAEALEQNPKAKAFFETLNKTNRYAVLWRAATPKTPAGRAQRIQTLVAMLEAGKVFH
ncbi:MAG TPA: YdeI/OmpD-associated family protein [Candidatus Saccharimonadales bacterium]|nr:YdeI/OmpD-associated family protein [Candidatus Saccharimonadales bacterium]